MLIRYKKSYEKIAMGLLSFISSEKGIKTVFQTIHRYEEDPDWQLFLWKNDEDIIGVIGIQTDDQHQAVIRHISINPSYREEGIGRKMILGLHGLIGETEKLVPSAEIKVFFENCVSGKEKEKEETGK